ncbi:T9SS type B sorting domain-containing protein [Gaetbulibacter sp. M235]|uniref:T9SS type B sorting domain-containing protein n=1 Tax=Gaetbulibacter sp. M235 TaxID=3126510 RepID=UPI00374FCC34
MANKADLIVVHVFFFLFAMNFCWSQNGNIAPTITATGNQIYCPLSEINVVTDFDIVDPDDTQIAAVYIQISTGYQLGFDSLILNGTHPNIATSWNVTEGKLTLKGNGTPLAAYVDLIAAVKDVVFKSTSTNPSNKFFSFTIGDANYLPRTGHYYEYVSALGITWTAAKAAAELRTYYGLQGYLATILYPEEAQLAGEQAAGAGWIGGSDAQTEGIWKWVTGPEAGTIFWNGGPNGSTPNYANWNSGEPNNLGDEDYAHVTYNVGIKGSWNDLSNTGESSGDYQPKGYIVEYGSPTDPPLNISASTHISVAKITDTTPNSRCGTGSVDLEAHASTPTAEVLWFEASTGGSSIWSGNRFTPVINSTTTYYVLASVGCQEGERTPVVATVYEMPVIQKNIVFKNCDDDGMPNGFINYNLEEANDIITNNNSEGLTITYYKTQAEANSGVGLINPIYNNSEGNIVFARVETADGCYDISTIDLQVSTTSLPQGYVYNMGDCDDDDVIDGKRVFDLTQASDAFFSDFLPPNQNLSVHYYRSFDDAQLENNEILNQTSYINESAFSQTLFVRVESDNNGDCYGIGPHLQLIVHPRPQFEIDQTEIYCFDNKPVTLFTYNPNGDFLYEWKDESGQIVGNSPFITVVIGGTYTVIATSSYVCESFPVSFTVVQSAVANISSDYVSIVELSDNNNITINNDNNNLGIGDYEFALDNIDGPYQEQPYFDHVLAGSHIIYVKDKNLCGIAQLEVFILGFPKFFTPNNDGNNDTWYVKGLDNDYSNASVVSVFDRYGKLIKQLNAKNGYWDGTFNGQQLADSDYWFVAELVEVTGNVRTFHGHFSLVR